MPYHPPRRVVLRQPEKVISRWLHWPPCEGMVGLRAVLPDHPLTLPGALVVRTPGPVGTGTVVGFRADQPAVFPASAGMNREVPLKALESRQCSPHTRG